MGPPERIWALRGHLLAMWAFVPKPQPEELLSSFLLRSCALHGARPYSFCRVHFGDLPVWNRDIDRVPPLLLLERLEGLAALSQEQLTNMTLSSLRCYKQPGAGTISWLLSAGIWHRKRTSHGLQICPLCLRESSAYFRKYWRLSFMTGCLEHGVALLDGCPGCDAPIVPHRSPNDLRRCHQCLGRIDLPARIIREDSLLSVQRWLLQAFQGEPVNFHSYNIEPRDWLVGCRQVLSVACRSQPQQGVPIERQRLSSRVASLKNLDMWLVDWPCSFRERCTLAGVTQRSFCHMGEPPDWLRCEVKNLPLGQARRRRKRPPLLGLRQIRRKHDNWREFRAEKLLQIIQSNNQQ